MRTDTVRLVGDLAAPAGSLAIGHFSPQNALIWETVGSGTAGNFILWGTFCMLSSDLEIGRLWNII